MFVGDFDSEIISGCVDQFNTIEYEKIGDEVYCQVDEYKWFRLNSSK